MRSHRVHHLLITLALLHTLVGAAVAAPTEESSQGMSTGGDGGTAPQATIRLSPEQRQMIGVTYGTVERTILKKTIRAVGRVDFDERRLTDITFKISGWVQDLFVDYTGKSVRKGE